MEINENELDKVAGGTVVETKEGRFIIMPSHAKEFETREEAEKAEKKFSKFHHHKHGHGHHHAHKLHKPNVLPAEESSQQLEPK